MGAKESKVWDIQRKSDFVNDVLQKTPSWIVAWGNTLFLSFLILLVLLAHFIKYPDTISAETTIRMKNPPIAVVSEKSEAIENIFFENGTNVKKGDCIIKLFSRADWQDVQDVERQILNFQKANDTSRYSEFDFGSNYELGELSLSYNEFLKEYDDFRYFISNDNTLKKINALTREISNIVLLNQSLKKQEELFEKKFELSEKNLERNIKLNNLGVISDQEKENIEANYLTESRQLEEFRTNQINNEVKIIQLRSTINGLLSDKDEELVRWTNSLEEKTSKVIHDIGVWKKQYLLKSPISGKVSFDKKIAPKYYVSQGEVVFNVIPTGEQDIIGLAEMPVLNSGDVKPGNEAQIRFDAFPYQEHGVVNCVVKEMSLLPTESNVGTINILELELPSNMKTNYGREIPFSNGMTATTLIIKERKSLLQRVFDQLYSIFSN